jgi:hypothetical protein
MNLMTKRAGTAFRAILFAVIVGIGVAQDCIRGQEVLPTPPTPTSSTPTQTVSPHPSALLAPTKEAWINLGDFSGAGEGRQLMPNPGLPVEPDAFVQVETAVVFPHLSSLLTAPVQLGTNGPTTTIALRNAHLDATVSPLFQFGALCFGPGYGEIAFSYRFLSTDGSDIVPAFDGPGSAMRRSRLDMQLFSLDYIRNDCCLGPNTMLSWDVGARLQIVFFDTQEQTLLSYQQASNYFIGAGPEAALSLRHSLSSEMSLFTRFDTAMVLGYNTPQNFTAATTDPVAGPLSGITSQQQTQLSPTFKVQAGITWTPLEFPACHWRAGYQFEQWYNLGRVANSRGDLNAQGVFLSCELSF